MYLTDGFALLIQGNACITTAIFFGGGVGGGPLIYKASVQNEFRGPEIITDINHTELKVWNIDLADSYPDLSMDEKAYWDI